MVTLVSRVYHVNNRIFALDLDVNRGFEGPNPRFFKDTAFSKSRLFQKHRFFSQKITSFFKNTAFSKTWSFKNTSFFVIKGTISLGFLPQIMANNTLGEAKMGENCDVSMWAKMSKYKRDDQKQEWYDDNLLFIYCHYYRHGREIKGECKRRNIKQHYDPGCLERGSNGGLVTVNKIAIYDKGLKVRQLVDWAITRYNNEEMVITEDGVNTCNVWVEFQNAVKPTVGKTYFKYCLHSWNNSD